MKENKPFNNPDDATPPPNPQNAVHEERLNSPSSDETIPEPEQTSTQNLQPLDVDMKVHHHTHPGHHKKKGQIISGSS